MNPRILIIDDDKDFREEYVYALRGLGYDPVEATNRQEAQQRLAEASLDRARLGILVAPGGLARDVEWTLARASNAPHLVVPLDRSDMEGWLAAPDRVAWLKDRIERAVLRQSGG